MIENLEIENFKSIKHLNLTCNRINLFIGEPNTGKSNILEALSLFSFIKFGHIQDFIRLESMSDLFYDENLDEELVITADNKILKIVSQIDRFIGRCYDEDSGKKQYFSFDFDYSGRGSASVEEEPFPIRFYRFSTKKEFQRKEADFLWPPSGDNLFAVLRNHKRLREEASQIFEPFRLRLVFRLQENKIEVMKQQEDTIVTYPYSLVSDTLQRTIFYTVAIDSNKNSILVFEEPESHTFPYYTKFLGEKIALDETNQYFIATHNPYLLLAILEKAKRSSINVFITYYKNYQTKIECLNDEKISELMSYDPFFNLNTFIKEDIF